MLTPDFSKAERGQADRFFSDEICVDGQEEQVDCSKPRGRNRTRLSALVHVLMLISSESHVMAPRFFQKGRDINTISYLNGERRDQVVDGRGLSKTLTSSNKTALQLTQAAWFKTALTATYVGSGPNIIGLLTPHISIRYTFNLGVCFRWSPINTLMTTWAAILAAIEEAVTVPIDTYRLFWPIFKDDEAQIE